MNFKKFLIFIYFVGCQGILVSGCDANQNNNPKNNENSSSAPSYHMVDESEGTQQFAKALSEPDDGWDLIHEGVGLFEQKKYDLAILKLTKALNARGGDKWTARSILEEAYEAKGDYALALEQVKWKISRYKNGKIPSVLTQRREELEKKFLPPAYPTRSQGDTLVDSQKV